MVVRKMGVEDGMLRFRIVLEAVTGRCRCVNLGKRRAPRKQDM